jgi:glucosamine-6-phosphate deaminase
LFYQELAKQISPHLKAKLKIHFLDEYLGITPEHPASFHVFAKKVGAALQLDRSQIRVFNTDIKIAEREAVSYEQELERDGLGLAILGIGGDGHIAFNMPGSAFDSKTRVVTLTNETRQANAGDFAGKLEQVPTQAVTMGIGTILKAKKIVLIATGISKAEILRKTLEGPVTESIPATALQQHPDVSFYVDAAAASLLKKN